MSETKLRRSSTLTPTYSHLCRCCFPSPARRLVLGAWVVPQTCLALQLSLTLNDTISLNLIKATFLMQFFLVSLSIFDGISQPCDSLSILLPVTRPPDGWNQRDCQHSPVLQLTGNVITYLKDMENAPRHSIRERLVVERHVDISLYLVW
jgi:hypothetical protein